MNHVHNLTLQIPDDRRSSRTSSLVLPANSSVCRPKILIVDDSPINLLVLKGVLQEIDATVIEAGEGTTALAAAREHNFALAILDVHMPGLDGYEVAEVMRSSPKTRNVPIMFVTAAYDDEIHMFRGYKAGAVDYLAKPIQPEVLLAKIRIFLELDHDRKELERHRNQLEEIVAERVKDIGHLNKVLQLLRELDQLIVRENSSQKLISNACRILANSAGFRKAWIVLQDERSGALKYAQSAFDEEHFNRLLDLFKRDRAPACCRMVHKQFVSVITSELCTECGDCGLQKACTNESMMIAELAHQDHHFGWMMVALPRDLQATDEETGLFGQIASDIGFALQGIATQKERDEAGDKLLETNKKLTRRNEEIQYFYHSLAHELKTPLTSAREFLSFVTERMVGDLNETQEEYLGFVRENCSNLSMYINDLLDVTRLDTGKLSLNRKPIDLCALVRQILKMMKNEADKKKIEWLSDLDPSLDHIYVDKSRITQLLLNLLTNAVKFTPPGGSVKVSLGRDSGQAGQVSISVTDTGCGIPVTQLPYIFRRYYQVESPNEKQTEGFGLGLYLCNEIAKLHGGNLCVTSDPGKGSTFRLLFPIEVPEIEPVAEKKQNAYVFKANPAGSAAYPLRIAKQEMPL